MAEAAKDQDQSMEDILQSIKRIIAEEGDPAPDATSADVLELTDLLADDGSVSKTDVAKPLESMSIDDIMAAPTPAPAPAPEPEPVAAAPAPAPAPVAADEGLISSAALSASVSALNSLRDSLAPNTPPHTPDTIAFRSGTTVEDLVLEALRPMLKSWLDNNLPGMVESLVKKEISKLTQG